MNTANKITMSRIVMSVIIIFMLLFPFNQFGISFPTYLIKETLIDTKYVIVGFIFVIAALTDFLDGFIARRYNMITDFGKTIDAISDKLLTNSILIILSCQGMINPFVTVIIIMRDTVTDALKMLVGNKKGAVGAIKTAKWKTATLMVGLALTLFYDFPFIYMNIAVSDFLLILAAILSLVSGYEYFNMSKPYLNAK